MAGSNYRRTRCELWPEAPPKALRRGGIQRIRHLGLSPSSKDGGTHDGRKMVKWRFLCRAITSLQSGLGEIPTDIEPPHIKQGLRMDEQQQEAGEIGRKPRKIQRKPIPRINLLRKRSSPFWLHDVDDTQRNGKGHAAGMLVVKGLLVLSFLVVCFALLGFFWMLT